MTWAEFKAMVDKIIDGHDLGGDPELESIDCWVTNPHGLHGDITVGGVDFHFKLDGQEAYRV